MRFSPGKVLANADAPPVMHDGHALAEINRRQVQEIDATTLAGGVQGGGAVVSQVAEGAGGITEQVRFRKPGLDAGHLQLHAAE